MYSETVGVQLEVLEDGQIQVCTVTHVFRDGTEIAANKHRGVVAPGDDVSAQDPRVVAVATAVWTPAVVTAFKQSRKGPGRP